jgi:protein-arginine kinase activator protein McsA
MTFNAAHEIPNQVDLNESKKHVAFYLKTCLNAMGTKTQKTVPGNAEQSSKCHECNFTLHQKMCSFVKGFVFSTDFSKAPSH